LTPAVNNPAPYFTTKEIKIINDENNKNLKFKNDLLISMMTDLK